MKDKLRMVPFDSIIIDERYRIEMGNMDELKASIQEKGILQPITLSMDMHLLAGGRRYTAAKQLGLREIPALLREITSEIDAREIELIENIHRKDFTWQEQASLVARIDALYKEKDPLWTGKKTAELIDQNPMNVSRSLRLAAGMKVLPQLAEVKTADEAMKVIKKAEEDAIVGELVRRQQSRLEKVAQSHAATDKDKGLANTLRVAEQNYIIGDTFKVMEGMRAGGHIHLIECDPPYGVDLATLTDTNYASEVVKQRDKAYHEISKEEYPEFLAKLAKETYRITNKNGWMIFWFSFSWYSEVLGALQKVGWHVDLIPAIWVKKVGRTPRPDLLLGRQYEQFFVCRKGQPTLVKQGHNNVFQHGGDEKKYHPAQRPVALMEEIIEIFCDGMETVFIPFAGSGATLRACYKIGHNCIGVDSNPEYKSKFLLAVEADTQRLLNTRST